MIVLIILILFTLPVLALLYIWFVGGVHVLATHVLQFMFLGSTGFRWPVCYFATTEAHASELVLLVWEVVNAVQSYGFKVKS